MTKIGDWVLASVHPQHNDGQDEAPALVTRVHDDGTVDLTLFVASGGIRSHERVPIFDSRAAADEARDAAAQDIKGRNPETGQAWTDDERRTHVLHWAAGRGAYPAAEAAPAPAKKATKQADAGKD
jgi:hypothetical protein